MMIGDSNRWWNRRLPILRIGIVVGVVIFGFWAWTSEGFWINDIVWGILHRHTATFRGQTLAVPGGWKEEERTNYNNIHLIRSTFAQPFDGLVTVTYQKMSPDQLHEMLLNLRGRSAGDYPVDEVNEAHYICLRMGFKLDRGAMVDCLSRDGRWNVVLLGTESNHSDFEAILHGVTAMKDPLK
jgi:hypothetical protein